MAALLAAILRCRVAKQRIPQTQQKLLPIPFYCQLSVFVNAPESRMEQMFHEPLAAEARQAFEQPPLNRGEIAIGPAPRRCGLPR